MTTYIISDINDKQRGLFYQGQLRPYHGPETAEGAGQEEAFQDDRRGPEEDPAPAMGAENETST